MYQLLLPFAFVSCLLFSPFFQPYCFLYLFFITCKLSDESVLVNEAAHFRSKTIYFINNTGPKPFYIERKPPRRTKLARPFRITPTRWCGNGCPHVRPHPGLTNLEFGRVYLYFR